MKDHHAARIRRNHFHNLCNVGFNVALDGVYLLGALSCGYGILTGTFSYGTFIAVLQLVGQIQSPLASLTGFLPQFYALLASAERLIEAERFPEEEVRGKLPVTGNWYRDSFRGLELRDVSFTYRPATGKGSGVMPVVFRDISFAIHKGEYVALTGASGSGKSTLLKLILCLYPLDRGERYLVSSSGQEELTPAWRRLFAYVPQGNQLMSGTIREVVAFGDQEEMWQDERVMRALRIACAEDFVLRQERGLDTLLGERGAGLSEGQMQRLAIARAIFSGRPILLLDEATSALDEATEARLLRNLRQMTERTVIIVTHRPAALSIVDRCVEIAASAGEAV